MSAQQKKLFLLKTKVGAFSQSQMLPLKQAQTSRGMKLQRNSTKLPSLTSNQILYSPSVHAKQKTLTAISTADLEDYDKNYIKFHSQKTCDGLDYRRYKIRSQDHLFSITQLGEGQGKHLFGMSDGHGTQGLPIAKYIGEQLQSQLLEVIQRIDSHNIKDEQLHTKIRDIYRDVDSQISQQQDIDPSQSGSTNQSIIIIGGQMLSINCGDSKAMFYYKSDFTEQQFHQWRIKTISNDHLPSRDTELERIKSHNGKVDQKLIRGQKQGQLQVYSRQKIDQGVHVTRCFGHYLQKQVGVIVDPEIIHFKFPKSGYLVLGSGSLWNYIDNMDIGGILNRYNPPKSQSELSRIENEIFTNAHHYWDCEHDGIQDISLIVVYIDLQQ